MADEQHIVSDKRESFWIFQAQPRDYANRGYSVCPGIFYMQGLIMLFLLHLCGFVPLFSALWTGGYRPIVLLYLLPAMLVWSLCVPADIKFRLQRPTASERAAFDNAVVNFVGYITFPIWFIGQWAVVIAGVVALLRHLLFAG